jgi:hypothetical protein
MKYCGCGDTDKDIRDHVSEEYRIKLGGISNPPNSGGLEIRKKKSSGIFRPPKSGGLKSGDIFRPPNLGGLKIGGVDLTPPNLQ